MSGFGVHEDGSSGGSIFADLYVNSANPNAGNGSSINPFQTLDQALNYLSTNNLSGYTIKMAGGTYTTALSFNGANSLSCEPNVIINYTGTGYLFNLVNQAIPFIVSGFGKFRTSSGGIIKSFSSDATIICTEIRSDTTTLLIPAVTVDGFVSGKINLQLNLQDGNLFSKDNHGISLKNSARLVVKNAAFNVGYNVQQVRCLYSEAAGINSCVFENCIMQTSINNAALCEFAGPQAFFDFKNCLWDLRSANTCTTAVLFSKLAGVNCSFSQSFTFSDNCRIAAANGTFTYSLQAANAISITILSLTSAVAADPAFTITNIFPTYFFDNGNAGAALAIDLVNGSNQKATLNQDCTLTVAALPNGFEPSDIIGNLPMSFNLQLVQDGTGPWAYQITLGAGLLWNGGNAILMPPLTAHPVSFVFQSYDKGATWVVSFVGAGNGLMEFLVSTVPAAASYYKVMCYISDEVGGPVPAFSDGVNWRRVTDRAIIS